MYARVTIIPVKGAERHQMEELANETNQAFGQFPGFQSANYLMNDDISEVAVISLWASREHATANDDALRTFLSEGLDGYLAGQPEIRIYEVYEKKKVESAI